MKVLERLRAVKKNVVGLVLTQNTQKRALYESHPQVYQATFPNPRTWGEIFVLYWGA
jgi:hypothetical protein